MESTESTAMETFSPAKRVLAFFLIEVLSGPLFFAVYFAFVFSEFENSVLRSMTAFLLSSDGMLLFAVLAHAMLISCLAIRILGIHRAAAKKASAIRMAAFMASGTIVNVLSGVVVELVKADHYLGLM